MNNKDTKLEGIIDIVVRCCSSKCHGVTREKVLSHCREENVVLTRCILAYAIKSCGYTVTTITELLSVSKEAVRKMLTRDDELMATSYAYSCAHAEVKKLIKENITATV